MSAYLHYTAMGIIWQSSGSEPRENPGSGSDLMKEDNFSHNICQQSQNIRGFPTLLQRYILKKFDSFRFKRGMLDPGVRRT